jgi:hypothetical protein
MPTYYILEYSALASGPFVEEGVPVTWTGGSGFIVTDIPNGTTGVLYIAILNPAGTLAAGDIDGYSLEEALKVALAALAGKASGLAGTNAIFRAADDSKARITATVDSDGNRTAVTIDETG